MSERDDGAEHQLPFWELVYGATERQEFTIEAPVLFLEDSDASVLGFGDVVLGTKYGIIGKPSSDSGLSASLEAKLPNADRARGLGSGATDVDLRARWGWEIGRDVVYFNLGHTWVGEHGSERRDNTWFYSGVWDHPVGRRLRLLTEVYGKTADEPGAPDRIAATIGLKWRIRPRQQAHLSIGRSLRARAEGGPKLRLYTGWRWDF